MAPPSPRRLPLIAGLVACCLLVACGGGGGGAPAPTPPTQLEKDLGTIPATSPTFFDLEVTSSFSSAGTVTLEGEIGRAHV